MFMKFLQFLYWPTTTCHHYISKSQSQYLKQLKLNLKHDEVIVVGDFSENYAFIVQDASQSFHWTNNQVTLQPFIIYYKSDNEELLHRSYCFISDCLDHTTAAVYTFQQNFNSRNKDHKQNTLFFRRLWWPIQEL